MLSAGAVLIGIAIGAVAASVGLVAWSRLRVSAARGERERLLDDARRQAEAVRREAQVEAREQAVSLRSEIESEVQDRRVEIAKIEERVLQKEHEADARLTELERKEQGLGDREVHVKALQDELRETQRDALLSLEKISGLTVHEARQQVLERSRTSSATSSPARSGRWRKRHVQTRAAGRARSSPTRSSASQRATPPRQP